MKPEFLKSSISLIFFCLCLHFLPLVFVTTAACFPFTECVCGEKERNMVTAEERKERKRKGKR